MSTYQLGYSIGQLILLLMFLVPAILFFLTQQNTLRAIYPENRELHPGLVWLQLIPIFNYYWTFVVVTRIADSISKQNVTLQDDSILGVGGFDATDAVGKRPTYKIGMAYCILYVMMPLLIIVANLFMKPGENSASIPILAIFMLVVILGAMTCWIIYWVQLVKNKRLLEYGRNTR